MGHRKRIFDRIRSSWPLLSILLVGSVLLSWGIWTVYPTVLLPDEAGAIERALEMGVNRNPFIDEFRKGGNLHLYLLGVFFVPYVGFLIITGRLGDIIRAASSIETAGINPWQGPEVFVSALYDFVVIGRILSVLAGIATIYVTFRIANRIYNRRAGLIAAGLLSVSSIFVDIAHYATEDSLLVLLITTTLLFIVRHEQRRSKRELLLAAFLAGLAFSAKATAGTLIFPLVLAFAYRNILDRNLKLSGLHGLRELVTSGLQYVAAATAAYVLTTPSILLYPRLWWSDFVFEIGNRSTPYTPTEPGWFVQLGNLANGLGLVLFIVSILSLLLVCWRICTNRAYRSPALYLLLFIIPTFLIIGSWETLDPWYLNPLVPALIIFSAGFFDSGLRAREWRRTTQVLLTVVVVVSFLYTGFAVQQFENDSRTQATEWMDDNIEEAAIIDTHSTHHYLPAFPANATVEAIPIYSFTNESARERAQARISCGVPDYVVLSRFHYGRYIRNPDVYPATTDLFESLLANKTKYKTIKRFGPTTDPSKSSLAAFQNSLTPNVFGANPHIVILKRTAGVDTNCNSSSLHERHTEKPASLQAPI